MTMWFSKWKKVILRILVTALVLSAIGTPTYLYLRERDNVRRQELTASFRATFGNDVTILGYEELTKIPVALFKTKLPDGAEYTVLAGEFGSSWVILTQKETTQATTVPATPSVPIPDPLPTTIP